MGTKLVVPKKIKTFFAPDIVWGLFHYINWMKNRCRMLQNVTVYFHHALAIPSPYSLYMFLFSSHIPKYWPAKKPLQRKVEFLVVRKLSILKLNSIKKNEVEAIWVQLCMLWPTYMIRFFLTIVTDTKEMLQLEDGGAHPSKHLCMDVCWKILLVCRKIWVFGKLLIKTDLTGFKL